MWAGAFFLLLIACSVQWHFNITPQFSLDADASYRSLQFIYRLSIHSLWFFFSFFFFQVALVLVRQFIIGNCLYWFKVTIYIYIYFISIGKYSIDIRRNTKKKTNEILIYRTVDESPIMRKSRWSKEKNEINRKAVALFFSIC